MAIATINTPHIFLEETSGTAIANAQFLEETLRSYPQNFPLRKHSELSTFEPFCKRSHYS
ncbi:MAG: hypothetical protein KME54_12005 [Tolypothrix brevis GSE-NOS-MK-07-07A]|nr:hypothetical protein [Tolypothrix brevis GSE-NOS-MK-07-07A]